MKALFLKEVQSFFNSMVGYIIIASFLIVNALLLWVFKGYSNIIHTGFANMNAFFNNSAWIFAFVIPAITMKSFADEYTNGTIEILKTLPIKHSTIVLSKFLAYVSIICIGLLFSLVFVYSVYQLGDPVGNMDLGSTTTSYIGLILLAATYTSIGVFCSIFTKNSISSFVLSVAINCILFFGFSAIENLSETSNLGWNYLGIQEHFNSISRGVIDIIDITYFLSCSLLFLVFTKFQLDNE